MRIVFIGRSKFGLYCKRHFPDFQVEILNPQALSENSLDNVDIAFYSRNINSYDYLFLSRLIKTNRQCRFVFLDTELNKNRFLLNSTLLLKKMEYYTLKRYFKSIERYYIPIVLGENMNWSNSLKNMSEREIKLKCFSNGSIQIIEIGRLLQEIITYNTITPKLVKVSTLAEDYSVELELVQESFLEKIVFYIKYNPFMSLLVLLKNQVIRDKPKQFASSHLKMVQFTGFYKMVIRE